MKKIFSFILVICMVIGLMPAIRVSADVATDESGVYLITSAEDLRLFAAKVTLGQQNINGRLMNDIDMTGVTNYVPIGSVVSFSYDSAEMSARGYEGTFDGNGYTIRNLTFNPAAENATAGVFGQVNGTVKNLTVENFTFNKQSTTDGRFGAVAGIVAPGGVIENCKVSSVTINANNKIAGGVAGCNYAGTIKNCIALDVTISAYSQRGGCIVGDNQNDGTEEGGNLLKGSVENCYTDGAQIAGKQSGTVSNSMANVSST